MHLNIETPKPLLTANCWEQSRVFFSLPTILLDDKTLVDLTPVAPRMGLLQTSGHRDKSVNPYKQMVCVATGADWSIIGEGNSASFIRRNIQLSRDCQLEKYGPKIKESTSSECSQTKDKQQFRAKHYSNGDLIVNPNLEKHQLDPNRQAALCQ